MVSTFCKFSVIFMCVGHCATAIARSNVWADNGVFDDFMRMVDKEKVHENRANEYFFKGDQTNHKLTGTDRAGVSYLQCVQEDPSVIQHKTRCVATAAHMTPACYLTYNFNTNDKTQGCYELRKSELDTCNDECKLSVSSHRSIPDGRPRWTTVVGFCCCKTTGCNEMAKENLDAAYAEYMKTAQPLPEVHVSKESVQEFYNMIGQ